MVIQLRVPLRQEAADGSDDDEAPFGTQCSSCFAHVPSPHTNGIEGVTLCTPCSAACMPCPARDAFAERETSAFTCQLCGEQPNPSNNPWHPCRPVKESDYTYTMWVSGDCEICTACYEALDDL
jgi:hypothetical protein